MKPIIKYTIVGAVCFCLGWGTLAILEVKANKQRAIAEEWIQYAAATSQEVDALNEFKEVTEYYLNGYVSNTYLSHKYERLAQSFANVGQKELSDFIKESKTFSDKNDIDGLKSLVDEKFSKVANSYTENRAETVKAMVDKKESK